jgi:hypothetical protein
LSGCIQFAQIDLPRPDQTSGRQRAALGPIDGSSSCAARLFHRALEHNPVPPTIQAVVGSELFNCRTDSIRTASEVKSNGRQIAV